MRTAVVLALLVSSTVVLADTDASFALPSGAAQAANALSQFPDVLPDATTAIKVGGPILERWMGEPAFRKMMRGCTLHARLYGDDWSVFIYPSDATLAQRQKRASKESEGKPYQEVIVVAGGGAVVVLSRHDAQVKTIHLER